MKYLDKYPNCVGCPVKKWCGTMISCLRLCRSYKDNKEETKMDYKKRYNQAIEAAKRELHCCGSLDCDAARQIFRLFPELRESEDEKWRNWLIGHLKGYINQTDNKYAEVCKKAISWLEKQGEQNTIVNESPSKEMILAVWELGNIWKELTKGSSCTEYGTQLQYIQKHWNESDYYEKLQGEQKPIDKVEPKFHEGEWITIKE